MFFLLAFSTQIFAGWDIKSNYNESVSDVFFINENIGWMVTGYESIGSANSGLILKTNDGGLSWSSLNIGYPNILYAVPFVDENIGCTAGNHSVNFNASNLSSGIYFYRISSGASAGSATFTKTNKMILLR